MIARKGKKALPLHYAGDEVFEIYGTIDNTGDEKGFDETKQALTNYFKPKVNTEFEIFEFRHLYAIWSRLRQWKQLSLMCCFLSQSVGYSKH